MQILHILYPGMSTATGRGRLFFQAVGDPTGPSELAPKTLNSYIESSLTKNLGIASSQFLDILYPWIGSIRGHYRLVRPGRRGPVEPSSFIREINRPNIQSGERKSQNLCHRRFRLYCTHDRVYQRKSADRMKTNVIWGLKYFRGRIIWIPKCTRGLDNISSLASTVCPCWS